MSKHDDGGPAYPVTAEQWAQGFSGMTLLDRFAEAQMRQMAHRQYSNLPSRIHDAYDRAAAMIAEKRRREAQ